MMDARGGSGIQLKSGFAQSHNPGFEILWPGRDGGYFLPGARVFECKGIRMEHLTACGVISLGFQPRILRATIHTITDEWEAEMFEMNPDLVGAAGVKHHLDERRIAETLEHAKTRARFPAFPGVGHSHDAAVGRMPDDGN